MDGNTLIKVVNRDSGSVGYVVPDLGNLRRTFEPREEKEVTFEELKKLSYLPGGRYILENCLVIRNEEAVAELLGDVEPEYFYDEKQVKDLLLNGSYEQFLDCLDFAPDGVIECIKDLAVKLPLNDVIKREAILKKTGFDINKAVEMESDRPKEDVKPKRRAAAPTTSKEGPATAEKPKRRYNVTE